MSTQTASIAITKLNTSKQLTPSQAVIWKEWRENRSIIVGMALLAAVIFMIPAVWVIVSKHSPDQMDKFTGFQVSDFLSVMIGLWMLAGAICGSSMVAPEVGKGSLLLLDSLPITRTKLWILKFITQAGILLGSIVASSLTMLILCAIGLSLGLVTNGDALNHFGKEDFEELAICVGASFLFLAVGSVVSMLSDRVIPAIIISIVMSISSAFLIAGICSPLPIWLGFEHQAERWSLLWTVIVGAMFIGYFLSISHKIFTQGESLKTAKRFNILAGYLMPPMVILISIAIAFIIIIA